MVTKETKKRNTLLIRLDDETAKRVNEIIKTKRWTRQTFGEVVLEHYFAVLDRAAKIGNGGGK